MHHHDHHNLDREDLGAGLLLATQTRSRDDDGGGPIVSIIVGLIGLGVISGPFAIITVPAAIVLLLIVWIIFG